MTSLKRSADAPNITSKIFVRTTKASKAQKIVREEYLRQDIACSSKLCQACLVSAPPNANGVTPGFVLSESPAITKKYSSGHYLVPDTNAFLNAMDLFEETTAFYDVIVLQTVLEEVNARSRPIFNRLSALLRSGEKRFYLFMNEFRLETKIYRESGETINDRNDRAVREATKWYSEHLKRASKGKKCPAVVMLTDDKGNLEKAAAEGVDSANLKSYVSQLDEKTRLLDMLSTSQFDRERKNGKSEDIYPKYYSTSKIATGVKAGVLHQGTFSVSPYNYLEGSVHTAAFDRPLLILGRDNSNRAIAGDLVAVEVLPKSQWKAPSSKIIDEESLNKNDNPDEEGDNKGVMSDRERRALQEEVKKTHGSKAEDKLQPTAKVVAVVKTNWRQYVGHVDQNSSLNTGGKQKQSVFVIPMDKRIPKIRIRSSQVGELLGKRILVTIDEWTSDSRYPAGHFVRDLGELETKGAETEALLLEYDVQYRPFPKAVLDCLPAEGHDWKVPPSLEDPGWKNRKDLRDLLICSIDPPGCQDIDDALHARKLPNGNFEVGVHIADVSHFVKPNNAMDAEASIRGTTVYLVDKRIDMLPMLLGTDLCSLKPYVERYAFSTIWELTPSAEIVSSTFFKSVIQSREAFSYEQAQLRIDDTSQQDPLTTGMRILLSLSKLLKAKRMSDGALNLASPEVRVQSESETSDPVDVKTKELLETNSLVEEFMLLANTSVAARIHEGFPQTALLRRHAAPPASNFDELAAQLKTKKDLSLDVSSSKALADSLDECVDPKDPFFNTLVRILATRCMMSAEYFVAGTQAYEDFRHYGLASVIYTHFTSPIRRYADLVAHRQLAAAIGYDEVHPSLNGKAKLEGVCRNINVRHRNAQLAGRASVEYYVGQALKGRVTEEDGFVMRVFSNGFVVFVPRFGIEGTVRVREMGVLKEEDAEFDSEEWILTVKGVGAANGEKTGKGKTVKIELFEKVKVRIRDVKEESTGKRKMKMELL